MEVPQKLAERRQWILWRLEDGDRKVPYQPNGRKAKSNNPSTWSTLADCQAVASQFTGLGFVFAAGDGLFGVDLDSCRNPDTGEIADWAAKVIAELPTYAEVSPSGTGVKLYGCGTLTTTGKRKMPGEPINGKHPAIEAYQEGRYFAFTGEWLDGGVAEVCEVDTSIIERLLKPEPPKARQTTVVSQPSDIADRAAKYLATMPPAISGQGGHNQTFRAACVLVLGFGLAIDEAFPLLSAWNQSCQPQWSDKDLWHKLTDANSREGERGFLLTDRQYSGPDVDLRAILADVDAEQLPIFQALPVPQFPVECLQVDGLIGEIMRHNLDTALYPQPELALAGAIALLATITGRKVMDHRGTRTNLYILGLAPSGAGKEHARRINKELLIRAGGELLLGPERIASSAGLVASVNSEPAILFQIDEIGHLLATMKNPAKSPHLFNIGSVLMQLYSSSGTLWKADAYADQKKNKAINQPHAVVYGTGVPDGFWDNLTAEAVRDGLLGRMLCFQSRFGYVPMVKPASDELPESIIAAVREWLQFDPGGNLSKQNPQPKVIGYDADAEERMRGHLDGICERRTSEDSTQAAVWSRSGEKTAKLALIFACSRGGPSETLVRFGDVDRAIKISNFLTRSMLHKAEEHVAENETESKAKRLLRAVDGVMTMSELTRKTQWLRGKERMELIADLVSGLYLETDTAESTGGRKAVRIWRYGMKKS